MVMSQMVTIVAIHPICRKGNSWHFKFFHPIRYKIP